MAAHLQAYLERANYLNLLLPGFRFGYNPETVLLGMWHGKC